MDSNRSPVVVTSYLNVDKYKIVSWILKDKRDQQMCGSVRYFSGIDMPQKCLHSCSVFVQQILQKHLFVWVLLVEV